MRTTVPQPIQISMHWLIVVFFFVFGSSYPTNTHLQKQISILGLVGRAIQEVFFRYNNMHVHENTVVAPVNFPFLYVSRERIWCWWNLPLHWWKFTDSNHFGGPKAAGKWIMCHYCILMTNTILNTIKAEHEPISEAGCSKLTACFGDQIMLWSENSIEIWTSQRHKYWLIPIFCSSAAFRSIGAITTSVQSVQQIPELYDSRQSKRTLYDDWDCNISISFESKMIGSDKPNASRSPTHSMQTYHTHTHTSWIDLSRIQTHCIEYIQCKSGWMPS